MRLVGPFLATRRRRCASSPSSACSLWLCIAKRRNDERFVRCART
ncbi:hypothetical protein HMPREF1980_02246 [Actinomyces sp. oral taxon 172 str. F0311]|nr:hypothetical protein HMPREF1980_02246 [Actinomyces sp. oral taxon 172 str. F0311]